MVKHTYNKMRLSFKLIGCLVMANLAASQSVGRINTDREHVIATTDDDGTQNLSVAEEHPDPRTMITLEEIACMFGNTETCSERRNTPWRGRQCRHACVTQAYLYAEGDGDLKW